MLTDERIMELANTPGARKTAVLNFLSTVDANTNAREALANLDIDSKMYKWNLATKRAIRIGIKEHFQ